MLPSLESISAAAQGDIPADTKVMLTCSSDPEAYPISGFTWIILYKEQNYNKRSLAQAEETLNFLSWIIEKDAQALAQQVNYAPLPAKTVAQAKAILASVEYDGTARFEIINYESIKRCLKVRELSKSYYFLLL